MSKKEPIPTLIPRTKEQLVTLAVTGLVVITVTLAVIATIEAVSEWAQIHTLVGHGFHCISLWGRDEPTTNIVMAAVKTGQADFLWLLRTACFPPAP